MVKTPMFEKVPCVEKLLDFLRLVAELARIRGKGYPNFDEFSYPQSVNGTEWSKTFCRRLKVAA